VPDAAEPALSRNAGVLVYWALLDVRETMPNAISQLHGPCRRHAAIS